MFARVLFILLFLGAHVESLRNSKKNLSDEFSRLKSEMKQMLFMTGYNQGKTHEKLNRLLGIDSKESAQRNLLTRLEALETSVKNQKEESNKRVLETNGGCASSGAVYVRWGRHDCPANGTETIYKGFTGGDYFAHTGGSVNFVCLPQDPLWDEYDDKMNNDNQNMHGAEYLIHTVNISGTALDQSLNGYDVPCVVCQSKSRRSVLTIPGRNLCYGGWYLEYSGYLMSGKLKDGAASEYICVDRHPIKLPGSMHERKGKYVGPVEAHCLHSLKCPPYVHGRELTCSVCTK